MRNSLIISAGFIGIVLISYFTSVLTSVADRRPAAVLTEIPGVTLKTTRNMDDGNYYTQLADGPHVCYIVTNAAPGSEKNTGFRTPAISCFQR
jgi:hypothetical protein